MRVLHVRCGDPLSSGDNLGALHLPPVPSRADLRALDAVAASLLPEDPTPSLEEISAQPDVAHLGTPQLAPQREYLPQPLRLIVEGSDAALSAVLTRMMRADYLWAEIGFVPSAESVAAQNWGLPTDPDLALELAMGAAVDPVPLIRNDQGIAVAGSATITQWTTAESGSSPENFSAIEGEVVVDNHVLLRSLSTATAGYGVRLVPMIEAPGIAAVACHKVSTRKFLRRTSPQLLFDPDTLSTGRALQAGGPQLAVEVDGIRHKRALERITFYRHLRDLQIVRER